MGSLMTDRLQRWKIPPSIRSSSDRDGCVLLDTEKGVFYGANSLGSQVWELIREKPDGITVESLVERLVLKVEAPRDQLMSDLDEYLRNLAAQGLLVREPAR